MFTDQTMPSTVGAVLRLLGNIEEVQFFIKYRKLLKDQPWNHSFKDKYDIALAKVQTKVLKKHTQLKHSLEDKSLTTMAEKLLRYWKMDVF